MSAGKGDSPRPVDMDTYSKNYESIFRKPKQDSNIDFCECGVEMVKPAEDPVSVETEYRLLEVGELIQEGDEYYCGLFRNWQTTNMYGRLVYNGSLAYRR